MYRQQFSPELIFFQCFHQKEKDFPSADVILRSGSAVRIKLRLKSLRPENTDKTMNKAMVLTITPRVAIRVIIFMALLLLLERK